MRTETRNILLYVNQLKTEIKNISHLINDEEQKNDINFLINEIIERIKYQLQDEEKNYIYILKEIKENQKLLEQIKDRK